MSFKERFLNAETRFLAALNSGEAALSQFDSEWEVLHVDFQRALNNLAVEADDVDVAHGVASRIAILGDSFLQLEQTTSSITTNLLDDFNAALAKLSLQDHSTVIEASTAHPHSRTPPYVPVAFLWLLENLHDPYPSSSLKRMWARTAQMSARAMDDWFKVIRKEIGWVALTKTHFHGSRSSAVAAASAVFLDNSDEADVPFEVQTELFAIKARLENQYLKERGLAAGLSTHKSNKRPRSLSTSSSATDMSRSLTPSAQPDSSSDNSSTASSSPSTRGSLRLPSLVLDQSDSEEDEQLPDFFTPGLLDNAAIRITDISKADDASERRLKRRRHSYYDLSIEDSPPSWPTDPFAQLVDTQDILLNGLAPHPDFWSFPIEESSSPETSATALIDVIPTVDNAPASPIVAAPTSRKRRHEDAELDVPTSKKSRVTRSLPRSNPRKELKAAVVTPVLVANAPPTPVEEPIVINWEQLLKDLEEATSKTGDASFDVSGPVDCGVFDFAALESSASTNISSVDDSWDKLFPADAPGSNSSPTDEELFAFFTNVDTLAGPDFPASADVSTVSIELPLALSSDLGLGTGLTSEMPTYELYSSTTSLLAQAGEPEISSLCSGSDNTTQLAPPDSAEASPSIFDVLSRLDSGGIFDTYSSPLVAFS